MPTAGGFSNPQFSEINLDNDAFLDLFVFDRAHHTWRTFVYDDNAGTYTYAPEYEANFPSSLEELVLLRDYNCDGFMDIFTYNGGGFRVFRNTGAFPPEFELVKDKLRSLYGSQDIPTFTLPGDIPAIVDVDGDGDLDILGFGTVNSENTIEYHQNRSMEEYSHCDSLEFTVVTQCWGNVEEPANSSSLDPVTCKGVVPPQGSAGANRGHPGSTVLLIDTDGDDDKDLILGDIQTDVLLFAPNIGDASSATIDATQTTLDFPNATDPVGMQYLVSGFEIDADHDGTRDLLLSVNNRIDSSCNTDHVWLYDNALSTGADYTLNTKSFLVGDMLDLGTGAVPVNMDVNGDSKEDLLIAVDYKRTPTQGTVSRLYYFENTGTTTAPAFTLEDDDFAGWSAFGFQGAYPALGDMDDDGDLDMIVGVADGLLHYFRNDPQGGMADFNLIEPNYQSISSIGSNAAPEIADLNGDGLLDLIVGERVGILSYFENGGTATSASFTAAPTINNFGGIDISPLCCSGHAAPKVVRNSAYGPDTYLFIGSTEKEISIFTVPSDLSSTFTLSDSIMLNVGRIAPLTADLDGDGIFELLIGTGDGGVKYYDRDANYPVGIDQPEAVAKMSAKIFPNPAKNRVTVRAESAIRGHVRLMDLGGRIALEKAVNGKEVRLNLSGVSPGSYLLVIEGEMGLLSRPLIILP